MRRLEVGDLASDGLEELGRVLLGGGLLVRRHFVFGAGKTAGCCVCDGSVSNVSAGVAKLICGGALNFFWRGSARLGAAGYVMPPETVELGCSGSML